MVCLLCKDASPTLTKVPGTQQIILARKEYSAYVCSQARSRASTKAQTEFLSAGKAKEVTRSCH